MNKQTSRHSSLFLLELITAIFFFCLASAVCIRFFVKSHTISQDTKNLDMAVNQTVGFAERFRSGGGLITWLDAQYPEGTHSSDGAAFTLYYDKDWTPCPEEQAAFTLEVQEAAEGNISAVHFRVTELGADKEIYTLEAEKYIEGTSK